MAPAEQVVPLVPGLDSFTEAARRFADNIKYRQDLDLEAANNHGAGTFSGRVRRLPTIGNGRAAWAAGRLSDQDEAIAEHKDLNDTSSSGTSQPLPDQNKTRKQTAWQKAWEKIPKRGVFLLAAGLLHLMSVAVGIAAIVVLFGISTTYGGLAVAFAAGQLVVQLALLCQCLQGSAKLTAPAMVLLADVAALLVLPLMILLQRSRPEKILEAESKRTKSQQTDPDWELIQPSWGTEPPSKARVQLECVLFRVKLLLLSYRPPLLLSHLLFGSLPFIVLFSLGLKYSAGISAVLVFALVATAISTVAATIELSYVGWQVMGTLPATRHVTGLPISSTASATSAEQTSIGQQLKHTASDVRTVILRIIQCQAGLVIPAQWGSRLQQTHASLALNDLKSLEHTEACVVLQELLQRNVVTITNAPASQRSSLTHQRKAKNAPPSVTLYIQQPQTLNLIPGYMGYPAVLANSAVQSQCTILQHLDNLFMPVRAFHNSNAAEPHSRRVSASGLSHLSIKYDAAMESGRNSDQGVSQPQLAFQVAAGTAQDVAACCMCFHTLMPSLCTDISISSMKLPLEAHQVLGKYLESDNCVVRNITLKDVHISRVGLEQLCTSLGNNTSVQSLDLSSNRLSLLGPRAPADLRSMLNNNKHLQHLNLAYTGLGSEAVAEVLLGASASSSLTWLDVSQNRASDQLPAALLLAWPPEQPPLTHLNLGFNWISDCLAPWLMLLLTHFPHLTHVWMDHNGAHSSVPQQNAATKVRHGKSARVSFSEGGSTFDDDVTEPGSSTKQQPRTTGGSYYHPDQAAEYINVHNRGLDFLAHLLTQPTLMEKMRNLQLLDMSGLILPLEYKQDAPACLKCKWANDTYLPEPIDSKTVRSLPITLPDNLASMLKIPGATLDLGVQPWAGLCHAQKLAALYLFASYQPRLLISNAPTQQQTARRQSSMLASCSRSSLPLLYNYSGSHSMTQQHQNEASSTGEAAQTSPRADGSFALHMRASISGQGAPGRDRLKAQNRTPTMKPQGSGKTELPPIQGSPVLLDPSGWAIKASQSAQNSPALQQIYMTARSSCISGDAPGSNTRIEDGPQRNMCGVEHNQSNAADQALVGYSCHTICRNDKVDNAIGVNADGVQQAFQPKMQGCVDASQRPSPDSVLVRNAAALSDASVEASLEMQLCRMPAYPKAPKSATDQQHRTAWQSLRIHGQAILDTQGSLMESMLEDIEVKGRSDSPGLNTSAEDSHAVVGQASATMSKLPVTPDPLTLAALPQRTSQSQVLALPALTTNQHANINLQPYPTFQFVDADDTDSPSLSVSTLGSQPDELWVSYASRPAMNSVANAMMSSSQAPFNSLLGMVYASERSIVRSNTSSKLHSKEWKRCDSSDQAQGTVQSVDNSSGSDIRHAAAGMNALAASRLRVSFVASRDHLKPEAFSSSDDLPNRNEAGNGDQSNCLLGSLASVHRTSVGNHRSSFSNSIAFEQFNGNSCEALNQQTVEDGQKPIEASTLTELWRQDPFQAHHDARDHSTESLPTCVLPFLSDHLQKNAVGPETETITLIASEHAAQLERPALQFQVMKQISSCSTATLSTPFNTAPENAASKEHHALSQSHIESEIVPAGDASWPLCPASHARDAAVPELSPLHSMTSNNASMSRNSLSRCFDSMPSYAAGSRRSPSPTRNICMSQHQIANPQLARLQRRSSLISGACTRVRGLLVIGQWDEGNVLHVPLKDLLMPLWFALISASEAKQHVQHSGADALPRAVTFNTLPRTTSHSDYSGMNLQALQLMHTSETTPHSSMTAAFGNRHTAPVAGHVGPDFSRDLSTDQVSVSIPPSDELDGEGMGDNRRNVKMMVTHPSQQAGTCLLELHLKGVPENQDLALDSLLQLVNQSHPAYAKRAARPRSAQGRVTHFNV